MSRRHKWECSRAGVAIFTACLLLLAGGSQARGQGGGNANAIGLSMQGSANTAAETQNSGVASANRGSGASNQSSQGASSGEMGMDAEEYDGGEMMAEGEMMEEYDEGSMMEMQGGYGQGRRGGQGGVGQLLGQASGMFAEKWFAPGDQPVERFDPTLKEMAALAAAKGNQQEALALYDAFLVAGGSAAASGHDAVGYNSLSRRPAWALRLAVSIEPVIDEDMEGDPEPLRAGMTIEDVTSNRGGVGRGQRRTGRGNRGAAAAEDYGDSGGSGEPAAASEEMAEMAEMAEGAPQPGGAAPGSGAGRGGAAMAEPEEMYGEGMDGMAVDGASTGRRQTRSDAAPVDTQAVTHAEIEKHLGMLADLFQTALSARVARGQFGQVLAELHQQGTNLAPRAMAAGAPSSPSSSGQPKVWVPGIQYLGTGKTERMLDEGRQQGIDVLLHFDVIAKLARNGDAQYDARLRVIDTASGKNMVVSEKINKRDVLLAARRRDLGTVIDEILEPMFTAFDERVMLREMPPLAPQHALARIDSLLAARQADRIDRLAEIMMFRHRDLIDDEQLDQIFYYAAGEPGLRLLYDTPERRSELAESLARRMLE